MKWFLSILAAIAIVLIGFNYLNNYIYQQKQGPAVETVENNLPDAKTMTIFLNPQNNSGETGVATLTEVNGKTTVEMVIAGAPEGVVQSAHIHKGQCPNPSEYVIFSLTDIVNGHSKTEIDTTLDKLQSEKPFAINVHTHDVNDKEIYMACGDFK